MKIAVPTRNNDVDDHFGHCENYTIFYVNAQNQIEKSETLPSPQGCGCKSNIADILKEQGVTVLLAGNMGNGALNVLTNHGIDVYRGCSGNVEEIAGEFLLGNIADSGKGCRSHEHHGEEHQCSH
ncbi:MAG: NifB/NifX family molybdenum-iron cluster-binding protein [Flavobacteriaceae bacterium]|nr:NifB/NifX family molybdenum-iron cluster-binding protein [Flavobacteriaceae bacterium]